MAKGHGPGRAIVTRFRQALSIPARKPRCQPRVDAVVYATAGIGDPRFRSALASLVGADHCVGPDRRAGACVRDRAGTRAWSWPSCCSPCMGLLSAGLLERGGTWTVVGACRSLALAEPAAAANGRWPAAGGTLTSGLLAGGRPRSLFFRMRVCCVVLILRQLRRSTRGFRMRAVSPGLPLMEQGSYAPEPSAFSSDAWRAYR
jgi:hypothetical protein